MKGCATRTGSPRWFSAASLSLAVIIGIPFTGSAATQSNQGVRYRLAMEAAASAKTLIGTNAPGLSEIVQDGQTGFLVPLEDWRALSETMCALIENPELRRQVGGFAREWAGQFREEEIVRQRELFYQEVVENAKI